MEFRNLSRGLFGPVNNRALAGAVVLSLWAITAVAGEPISFRQHIAPLLLDNCVACHGSRKAEGGFRVDTYEQLRQPGDSGIASITPGDWEQSELWRRLASLDESERMPAESPPLPAETQRLFQDWIRAGANFDGERPADALTLVVPPLVYPAAPPRYAQPVPITALAFSPDGGQLWVSGYHELTQWSVLDGRLVGRWGNLPERSNAVLFSPDGATLIVGGGEPGKRGEVRVFDLQSQRLERVVARTHDLVLDVAWRPASSEIAVASADNLIQLIQIPSGEVRHVIASHADWVTAVGWSADGNRLVSGSRDKSAKVYEADSGNLLLNYAGHGAAVRGVALSADGTDGFSASSDGKVHRWKVDGGQRLVEIDVGGESFKLVRMRDLLLIPAATHELQLLELSSNTVQQKLTGHTDWVLSVAYDQQSGRIATGSFSGEIRIWNSNGTLERSWLAQPSP